MLAAAKRAVFPSLSAWSTSAPFSSRISHTSSIGSTAQVYECGRGTLVQCYSVLNNDPGPKLIITDPDPQNENQEFWIRILDPYPCVN